MHLSQISAESREEIRDYYAERVKKLLAIKRRIAVVLCMTTALTTMSTSTRAEEEGLPARARMQDVQGKKVDSGKGATPRKGLDMVFLVDISKSMDDIFSEVRRSLIDYVQKALVGDRIEIISFGEKTNLAVARSIQSTYDKEEIVKALERMHPSDYSTYIVAAVEHGLKELVKLKNEGSKNISYLILITDGKNNPPKYVSNPMTFEKLLKSYSAFKPGKDWFMYYITLRDFEDSETRRFVQQVGGGIFNIESTSLTKCINNTEVPVLTRLIDIFDRVEVKFSGCDDWIPVAVDEPLREGDSVRTGSEARAVISFTGYGSTGVDVNTEIRLTRARANPVYDTVDISIHLVKGKLTNLVDYMPGYSSKFEVITPNGVPQVSTVGSTLE